MRPHEQEAAHWVAYAIAIWEDGTPTEAILARVRPHLQEEVAAALRMAQSLRHAGRAAQEGFFLDWAVLSRRLPATQPARRLTHALRLMGRWALALVLVLMVLGGLGLSTAPAHALPGDPLYGLKRAAEDWRYRLTVNPAERLRLALAYAGRRLQEAEAAQALGRLETAAQSLQAYAAQLGAARQLAEALPPGAVPPGLAQALAQHQARLEQLSARGLLPPPGLERAIQVLESLLAGQTPPTPQRTPSPPGKDKTPGPPGGTPPGQDKTPGPPGGTPPGKGRGR